MKKTRIDKIDRNILKKLQEEGRISNIKLSKVVGISPPPCLRRVRALEEAGYINGYNARINSEIMGYGVTIFAQVKLKSQAEADLKVFEDYICAIDMIRECHLISGESDFMLKIVAKSWDDYQEFFTKELSNAPNICAIKSSLTIRKIKHKAGIPI